MTVGIPMQHSTRHWMVEIVRETLISSTDIVRTGDEPYVGWSMVLAERIVDAIETGEAGGADT